MRTNPESTHGAAPTAPPSRLYVRSEGGDRAVRAARSGGYGSSARGASAAVLIVLPLLGVYEAGIAALGGDPGLRTGVDAWLGPLISGRSPIPEWWPSLTIALGMVAWRIAEPGRFRIRWLTLAIVESIALGAGLLGVFLIFDRWFDPIGLGSMLDVGAGPTSGSLDAREAVSLIGAGIFEEAVFRLGLLGVLYAGLRLLHIPNVLATSMAVCGSALVFSMAHHIGERPGAFAWPTFVFRWLAGVYFAWVFILRGFGIAVGTHVAYDLLVAADPWSA